MCSRNIRVECGLSCAPIGAPTPFAGPPTRINHAPINRALSRVTPRMQLHGIYSSIPPFVMCINICINIDLHQRPLSCSRLSSTAPSCLSIAQFSFDRSFIFTAGRTCCRCGTYIKEQLMGSCIEFIFRFCSV